MIFELQGYHIEIPDPPPLEQIDGYHLPKEEQYFRRPYTLTDEEFLELSHEEKRDIVLTEGERCRNGYWFMNYGEPFWVTGDAYFFLTYWVLSDGNRPRFIKNQMYDFYFYRFCELDDKCFGSIELKPRQEGSTAKKQAILVNRAIRNTDKHIGIQSKTGDDASKVNFGGIQSGFSKLPFWMKPKVRAENTATELVFGEPPKRYGTEVKKKKASAKVLNTRINWKSTTVKAYDGSHLFYYIGDECLAKGTKILCENFEWRKIEDIKVGDKVIVEGGKLIEVAETQHGFDEMYKVIQPYGNDYVVNSRHRLYLDRRCQNKKSDNGIKILTPIEWKMQGKYQKRTTYRVTSSGLNFEYKKPPLDPYLLGLWIGDGRKDSMTFIINTYDDIEIYKYVIGYCNKNGYNYNEWKSTSEKCVYVTIKSKLENGKLWNKNYHNQILRLLGIYGNKRIPKEYFLNSKEVRLRLLAGIIDTDGMIGAGGTVYSIAMSNIELLNDIKILANSLGFSTSPIDHRISNLNTTYGLFSIGGDIWNIPCIVHRKIAKKWNRKYNGRRDKIIDVKSIGYGEYFGITLKTENEDERRLILEDFTLTMNCFKWQSADAYKTWYTVRNSLGNKFRIWGKAFLLSTMGIDSEEEKTSEKALESGLKLWNESSYFEKNSLGFTTSGLYRWFIPAWASKIGTDPRTGKEILDKYGNVDESAAKLILLEERNNEKDIQRKIALIRQEPLTVQEALDTMRMSTGTTFVKIHDRLFDRERYLSDYIPTPEKPLKYRQGNLYWRNNERFTTVVFRDDPEGRWKIAYFPEMAGQGMSNRVKRIGDQTFAPYGDTPFITGLDPIEFEHVNYGEGSRAALLVKCLNNPFNQELSYVYCAQYFARPDTPTFWEDVYKTLFFYGCKINIERQTASGLFTQIKSHGLRPFLLKRPDAAKWNRKTMKDTDYGTPTSPKSIQSGLELIENYFSPPDPERNENDKDNLNYFWFEDTLKQLLECDPKNMTKFDLASAMVQTELASQVEKRFVTSDIRISKEGRNPLDVLFPINYNGKRMTHEQYLNARHTNQSAEGSRRL